MLDAHLDQIALLVINIEENGFLRTFPCGGIDRRGIHGTKVRVLGKDGEYPGIVCSVPPHIKDVNDKNPERDEIFIDIGFNKEETAKRVRMGDRVMLCGKWSDIGNGYVTGPALDDRSGCAVMIHAIKQVKTVKNDLYFVFTASEELGLRGAKTSAYTVNPDYAVAIDVTRTGDTPSKLEMAVSLGNGAAIKIKDSSFMAHPYIKQLMKDVCEENSIPHQFEVLERGGTDSGAIHLSGGGVPSGCISIPTRYIHSPAEEINADDLNAAVKLMSKLIEKGF
jgi:endoglucanase